MLFFKVFATISETNIQFLCFMGVHFYFHDNIYDQNCILITFLLMRHKLFVPLQISKNAYTCLDSFSITQTGRLGYEFQDGFFFFLVYCCCVRRVIRHNCVAGPQNRRPYFAISKKSLEDHEKSVFSTSQTVAQVAKKYLKSLRAIDVHKKVGLLLFGIKTVK